jgi:hypothetical protein
MLNSKGLRNCLMQVFPKRNFDLLIDPECIDQLLSSSHTALFQLLLDLRRLNPPIDIRFLVNERNGLPEPFVEVPLGGTDLIEYSPTNPLDDDPRAKLMEDTDLSDRQRKLCALAIQTKPDGVVTSDQGLLDARYPLLHDRINLVPMDELEDFVEICAHGHSIFWSASYSDAIYQDVYYIFAHPKCHKLATWWREIQKRILSPWVIEQLRSLIMNRYQFILYARDMVRFGRLQKDHYKRQGEDRFGFCVSYHVNQFYFLLWGMLDQLTLLSNETLQLGLTERKCGIASKDYLKELKKKKPNLRQFLSMPSVAEWINHMSDFRHAVAHQVIPMPTEIVVDTEDSKKPKEEIVKILESDDYWSFLSQIPNDAVKSILTDQAVYEWRHEKRKRVADHMVQLKNKEQKYYYWSPVISVDHDLAMLTGVMDAFLVGLFCSSHGVNKGG